MAHAAVRWIGVGVGVLVGLGVLAAGGVYAASESRLNRRYAVDPGTIPLPSDPVSLARGRHMAVAIGKCVDCHGANLGGQLWIDDPNGVGRFVTTNLTGGKGGIAKAYTDKDWLRALRHGVGPQGKALAFMPSDEIGAMSDKDLGAMIAYLKTVPAVDNELPASTVGPVGRALLVKGDLPLLMCETIDHQAPRPAALIADTSPAYGAYLARTGGCMGCHGNGLSGGPVPGTPPNDPNFPPAANLTPAGPLGKWSQPDFVKALRTGIRPDGSSIHPFMPWKLAGQMSDDEITATWRFLQQAAPKPTGGR